MSLSNSKKGRKQRRKLLLRKKDKRRRKLLRSTRVFRLSKVSRLQRKARKRGSRSARVLPKQLKQSLLTMPHNPRRMGKERWGSRQSLHWPLGNALAQVEQLPWSLFLWLRLQIQGWWFIPTRCSGRWCLTRKMFHFRANGVPHFWTIHCTLLSWLVRWFPSLIANLC